MDKQDKPIIKLKINGEEQEFTEEIPINDWQEVKQELAVAAEEPVEEDEFDWRLRDVETKEVPEFQKVNYIGVKRNSSFNRRLGRGNRTGVAALIFSISLAVIIGLVFGGLIWKMVISAGSETTIAQVEEPLIVTQDLPESHSFFFGKLPAMAFPVIQAGVFSTKEAGERAVNEMAGQGRAKTLIEIAGSHYLFIGVSGDLVAAKQWGNVLQQSALDVWAKELVTSEQEIEFGSEGEAKLLSEGTQLFYMLAGEATKGLLGENLNATVIDEIGKRLEAGKATPQHNELSEKLLNRLVSAYESILSFKQSGGQTELTRAQQELLDYLLVYYGASSPS